MASPPAEVNLASKFGLSRLGRLLFFLFFHLGITFCFPLLLPLRTAPDVMGSCQRLDKYTAE